MRATLCVLYPMFGYKVSLSSSIVHATPAGSAKTMWRNKAMPEIPPIDPSAFWLIVGAVAAILGGIVAGIVTARMAYRQGLKHAADAERKRQVLAVLEWAENGRRESLRHAHLQGADL